MKKEIKKIACIIDTDPGVDDTVAIALSLYDEVMDIKLITTVAGNKDIDTVTRNALHILERFDRTDIPVAKGADKAMCRISPDASFIHQHLGMGGYIPPETVKTKVIDLNAVEAMYKTICENKNNIVLICLGPYTNVGTLIQKHPDVVDMISHIYCEGCAAYGHKIEGKKWSNYVSFNASSDPEAMEIVMNSGVPITIIPSRMGRELANFTEEDVMKIRDINRVGYFFFQMYTGYWEHNYPDRRIATNDTCACMIFRFPKLFKTKKANFEINTSDKPGKTTVTFTKSGKINYAYKLNKNKMHQMFYDAIKKLDFLPFGKEKRN